MKRKIILFFVAVIVITLIGCSVEDPDAYKTKDNSTMAYVMAQHFVQQRLKSPKSAKFPSSVTSTAVTIQKVKPQIYNITAYVDSKNSFNADVRTPFIAEVEQTSNDNWKLNSLVFL